MFIPLLLIRYHLLFAAHVDLNSKKVIDSHLILDEKEVYIEFLTFLKLELFTKKELSLFEFKSIRPGFH